MVNCNGVVYLPLVILAKFILDVKSGAPNLMRLNLDSERHRPGHGLGCGGSQLGGADLEGLWAMVQEKHKEPIV
jgi:hypothetical protein